MKKTDLELIAESVRGQTPAFDTLVTRYQDRLFNALVQIVRDREEARDVAQETFVTAWSKLSSFRGDAEFYSWLFRVAYNTVISRRRKKRVATVTLTPPDQTGLSFPEDGRAPSPGDRLERQERQQMVHSALDELPEEFRSVLVLKEIENFKYEEIAQILDLPLGTIRSRIHRARILLREKLTRLLDEQENPGPVNSRAANS
ncbi:RNA polymerase sigma factor [Rubinisphaera margarita]|uniref:RNA polymerase sigma factor n=1 Tax=Rubinisphaera margarita TaxID=2909586 RepID=UPI001EE7E21F|nr:sigma-70 family RNA polymerase sigma factor [Rubinisphaera margarita]MCG6156871.1 sigma-70 family RNA polymerase sigma factor [Rubinisphaera margarita]